MAWTCVGHIASRHAWSVHPALVAHDCTAVISDGQHPLIAVV